MTTLETPDDLAREEEVAQALLAKWKTCTFTKTVEKDHIDRWIWHQGNNELKGILEIRTRHDPHTKFPDCFVPLRKYIHMQQQLASLAAWEYIRGMYVTAWDDFLGWAYPDDFAGYPIRNGGRKDRGLVNDMEPMIIVPWDVFHPITGWTGWKTKVTQHVPA